MDLFIIRHGIAADAGPGETDAERALTAEGVQKMRAAVAGLHVLAPAVAVIGHSPLRRARETAEILATAYLSARVTAVESLMPGSDPSALERWVAGAGTGPVAVVGHEPDLGRWIARLLTGEPGAFAPLKKGGVCALRLNCELGPGSAQLQWILPPQVLTALVSEPRGGDS